MRRRLRVTLTAVFLSLLFISLNLGSNIPPSYAQPPYPGDIPLNSDFTYQGFLVFQGAYYDGTCNFKFTLFNIEEGGSPIAGPIERTGVRVRNGYFTVKLNFGQDVFIGTKRWLEIGVRCNNAAEVGFKTLKPRQELTPTPYALALPGLWTQPIALDGGALADSPNLIGGYYLNHVSPHARGATIGGGGAPSVTLDIAEPFPVLQDGTITFETINRVTEAYGTVDGGLGNTADLVATVGGGLVNTAKGPGSTVGGGGVNTASGLVATVGGGYLNTVSGDLASISGGGYNTASYTGTTVSGGAYNTAGNHWATVGGGVANTVSGDSAVIGGGNQNVAGGFGATIGGGQQNVAGDGQPSIPEAAGVYATIPGGFQNVAQGNYSFAAGQQAKANHQGAFVWADAANTDLSSTGDNQFIVRANGGLWLGATGSPSFPTGRFINTSTGAFLSSSGTWTNNSDRRAKENLSPVAGQEILEKLAEMPITVWNYKTDPTSVQHIGPMAQDFYAAFGLGNDNVSIATIDGDGVALAAIQGLYQINQEQMTLIAELQQQHSDLAARVAELEALIALINQEQSGGQR